MPSAYIKIQFKMRLFRIGVSLLNIFNSQFDRMTQLYVGRFMLNIACKQNQFKSKTMFNTDCRFHKVFNLSSNLCKVFSRHLSSSCCRWLFCLKTRSYDIWCHCKLVVFYSTFDCSHIFFVIYLVLVVVLSFVVCRRFVEQATGSEHFRF